MDISSMLEVEVQEGADSKENVTPCPKPVQTFSCQTFSKEENDFYKLTYGIDVASVRFLRLHCTGCDEHIGSAPAESHNMHEHPVLRTLLCAKCREFYGDGTFEQGDDNTDMFCRWCANGGNLYCCSYCSNTFCSKCIKRNFDAPTIKRIEAEDSWKCFVCDPKDVFPLRSICRALITHIETVTRILENDKKMNPKEIEEKMHLDETKCCSRKRKRRRRMTNSDDDDEEDINYVPDDERADSPPARKRRSRNNTVRNMFSNTNGYMDHEYYQPKNKSRKAKTEPEAESENDTEHDPTDLLIPCEQTMIEGDTEILNPQDLNELATPVINKSPPESQPEKDTLTLPKPLPKPQLIQKISPNNTLAINPVPLANLLKVALAKGAKKIKVTHSNQKLLAVPISSIPKSVSSSSLKFIKPTFILPKLLPMSVQQPTTKITPVVPPNVIDLDSDDEPVILENNLDKSSHSKSRQIGKTNSMGISNEIIKDTAVPELVNSSKDINERSSADPHQTTMNATRTRLSSSGIGATDNSVIIVDNSIPLKTQKRDQRFKQMLKLQSQEIDSTLAELKTKILKLVQISYSKPQNDEDLLNSALTSTKRFHRALRKTLVELSHINDRVVRDYVHWKKKTHPIMNSNKKNKEKLTSQSHDLTVEMVCERESASENEDDDVDNFSAKGGYSIEANEVPCEFTQILDHLTLFKRKPTALKAIGDGSVLSEDKACQAYDVPWRDYEKCIGYSLVKKDELGAKTQEEQLQPDENFGKYQEQYLFYLQHIEDFGIETDELKGLPDPNHIPLKDLIEGTSPFIMDMLERLSPVTLSNGCASPSADNLGNSDAVTNFNTPSPSNAMEISSNEHQNLETQIITLDDQETDKSEENPAPTSKAVEELVKMVTKLSEDLRSEQETAKRKEVEEAEIDDETFSAMQSILDSGNNEQAQVVTDEIMEICVAATNNECTTLD